MNDALPVNGIPSVPDLLTRLGSPDDAVRGPAWQQAWTAGPSAIPGLADLMEAPDRETARAAKRALWNLVDHSSRPGAEGERLEAVTALLTILKSGKALAPTTREVLWMLSTIGDADAIPTIAACLEKDDLREDARCVLQRFPGTQATDALRAALDKASGDFAHALADALRARGESILAYPSRRLVPAKTTAVGKPV